MIIIKRVYDNIDSDYKKILVDRLWPRDISKEKLNLDLWAKDIAPTNELRKEFNHALLKKETLYNNNITSLQEYIQLVEEWILFYNTTRLKSKVNKKKKLT